MSLVEVDADQTFIKAGEACNYIYIVLSGKVTGVEWPMNEKSYFFKDFGPGDFFGEIECFAGMTNYRISILSSTRCRLLAIPSVYYMEWMHMDVDALYMRTQENMKRLVSQTAEARKYLFMDGKDRLMVHLVRKYEQKQPLPDTLELKQTRARISEEVGISMKTLNRNIKKLEDMKLIRLNKGKIVITKEQYLQMKADIDYYVNG
nr:Crp/Fnr family transcriptional regulator [uncultured Mediterraneibacter sp.]